MSPGGIVYIADPGRDQIIERFPNGRLLILAGTGHPGFSGDGGPARQADLNDPAGLAVAGNGTVYFADEANNRIRAISPSGVIHTIAGTGRGGWVRSGTRPLDAPLLSPAAVAFDPADWLTIADAGRNEVLRLDGDGSLTRLAGSRDHAGIYGIGKPAANGSADGPTALTYDRSGNLYIAGSNTKSVLMITPRGRLRLIGSAYPSDGGMAATPTGRVLLTNRTQILELTPHGTRPFLDLRDRSPAGIRGFDAKGIASDGNGIVYLDTWPSGYTDGKAVALIALRRGGRARALWRSG